MLSDVTILGAAIDLASHIGSRMVLSRRSNEASGAQIPTVISNIDLGACLGRVRLYTFRGVSRRQSIILFWEGFLK